MDIRARASIEQFATLLEFMESHSELLKPHPGPQARLRADRLWQKLAMTLNSIGNGVKKSADKWKKVWADWKSKTKKKACFIRRQAAGSEPSRLVLTNFEVRLLSLMGILAVEGISDTKEQRSDRSSQCVMPPTPMFTQDEARVKTELITEIPDSALNSPSSSSLHSPSPTPPPVCLSPPLKRRRKVPLPTPLSGVNSGRPEIRRRRIRETPFDRATSEFVAVELRRIELEETRSRQQHELELKRIEVDTERNRMTARLIDIAQAWLDYLKSK